jgi:ABC-type spermidine/putrescine transport system permease subunit I
MKTIAFLVLTITIFVLNISSGLAQQSLPPGYQQTTNQKISSLQDDVRSLQSKVEAMRNSANTAATGGGVSFLFGVFCALWAQNTNRSAWLWFFLGLFFTVITAIVLLVKNSDDKFNRQQRERFTHGRT